MLELTKNLRPISLITYPNYHKDDYFEEYFFKRFSQEHPTLVLNGYTYIPIFWTNCYVNKTFGNKFYDIQGVLNKMNHSEKYFSISQHDDCVLETLPENTIIFSMGGNKVGDNIIPIPLVCSPIKRITNNKDIKISFVGSLTHRLRNKLYQIYHNDSDFLFKVKNWELNTKEENVQDFINIMSRSKFTLSPRGYGKTSFRMYESFQLDSVPIYVYDEPWLPWIDEIDWDELIIKVNETEIPNLKYKVENTDFNSMINYKNELYDTYFTYDGIYNNIIKRLKKW